MVKTKLEKKFTDEISFFSSDVIHDICKTIILERRPAWDVVIRQGDPGDT